MRGDATLATANDAAMVEEIRAITRRYIVPEDVPGCVSRWPILRTIVTIVPAHVVVLTLAEAETLRAMAMAGQPPVVPTT